MKKILYIIFFTVLAVGIAFVGLFMPVKKEVDTTPDVSVEQSQTQEITYDENSNIMIYPTASPQILEGVNDLETGTKLKVAGKDNEFYHVQFQTKGVMKDGYIPTWYIDKKPQITSCDYGYLVLKQETNGLLYPDGPGIVRLEKGKLLRPLAEFEDWYNVSIIVYDIPDVLTAWVKKDSLVSTDMMQPEEGFLPSDAELYFVDEYKDIKNAKPQKETYPKSVSIMKREGGYVYVSAAGGWTAWVEEKWITYNDKDLK